MILLADRIRRCLADDPSQLRPLLPAVVQEIVVTIETAVRPLPNVVRSTLTLALTTTRLHKVSVLATLLSTTPRRLSRICAQAELPGPKNWLLLAHAIQLSDVLTRNPDASFSSLAVQLGYSDQFSLSRAMMGALGCRLSTLRRDRGLETIIARWIASHPQFAGWNKTA